MAALFSMAIGWDRELRGVLEDAIFAKKDVATSLQDPSIERRAYRLLDLVTQGIAAAGRKK